MTHSYIERELKFDVDPDFALPDLIALLPHGARVDHGAEVLRSDYFDTESHDLLAAGMTLRRRSGTSDEGWQLKVPHPPFREEIRADGGAAEVPDALRRLVHGVTRGQQLRQIATLTTDRSVTRLLSAAGEQLAEIADDTVHAAAGGDSATISQWRELEVELGTEREPELLSTLGKRLRKAGARPSANGSKLARALPGTSQPPRATRQGKPRASDVLIDYIAEQEQAILAGDLALRRGDDSIIHKTRVATRRLRSTLRVFAPLLDRDRASALDGQLRRYAAQLGEVRDRQVLRARLDTMLDSIEDTLLLGPVRTRIDTELRREQAEHWDTLQTELTSDTYLALLADIASWVRDTPLTAKAAKPADQLRALTRKADTKVTSRLRRANTTGDIHQLHDARKAAKRARYAAEAAEPVLGAKTAARQAKKYQKLQDLLGEHQDSLVSAQLLRRLGAKAGVTRGENGFAFGILHEREEQNARNARARARATAKKYST